MILRSRSYLLTAGALLWLAFTPLAAMASPVTYNYSGNVFTSFSSGAPVTGSNYIQITLEFASVLPGNLSFQDETGGLLYWWIGDGSEAIDSSYLGANLVAILSTDAAGNIVGEWSVMAVIMTILGSHITTLSFTSNNCAVHYGQFEDSVQYNDSAPPNISWSASTTPIDGWTPVSVAPEPSPTWLLIPGVVGLFVKSRYPRSS
jgi:hypothetical protein